MASIMKTIVATGATSGLGFEAIRQLIAQPTPYRLILGARNTAKATDDFKGLGLGTSGQHKVEVLPLNLSDLKGVKTFAQEALAKLGQDKLDYLFLNAGEIRGADKPNAPAGSKYTESYVVNHLSQHYLIHLLREKIVASNSRIVVVSSGAVRNVPDTSALEKELLDNSGTGFMKTYANSKFVQLLGAHWWRRQLGSQARVVAVSPGLIPSTGLGRHEDFQLPAGAPDAKTIPEGAASLLAAFTRDDFPEDPEQFFLTSWGEWWSKDVYKDSLDKALQDQWSPSKEEIEKVAGIAA